MTKHITIFDLDNCLADDAHRIALIRHDERDPDVKYHEYHDAHIADASNRSTAPFVRAALRRGEVLIFTARPDAWRESTYGWIAEHFPGLARSAVWMRAAGDHRHSVELKRDWLRMAVPENFEPGSVVAYDDRDDILEMYRAEGVLAVKIACHEFSSDPPPLPVAEFTTLAELGPTRREHDASVLRKSPAEILRIAAATFEGRNKTYGQNYLMIAPLVRVLFPDGVPSHLVTEHTWHLFELILVKLSRFATSHLSHQDSIHDLTVYSAMVESLLKEPRK